MELASITILALIKKAMDVVKFATNRQWNAVVTQVAVWVFGVLAVLLVAQTSLGEEEVAGFVLAQSGFWTQVLVGLLVGSSASLATDTLKAIDNKTTAATPALLPAANRGTTGLEGDVVEPRTDLHRR